MTDAIPCKYFPQLPARWRCLSCQVNMADACATVPEPNRSPNGVKLCPICGAPLQSLGIGNSIQPLWQRIPKFFLYPAKADALVYIGCIALFNLLGVMSPVIAIVGYLVSMGAVLKYAFKCLNHSARGHLEPPSLMVEYAAVSGGLLFKQSLVFALMGVIVALAATLGPVGLIGAALFTLMSIPASTMLLAIDGSVLAAVNPLKLVGIMAAVGRSYWILYVFLLMLTGGQQLLSTWGLLALPAPLVLPLEVFLIGYFTVVMYAMMGYLIYQHHEELGFEDVKEFQEASTSQVPGLEDDPFLNAISILIKEGMLDEALKRMEPRMRHGASPKEREKYHKLLALAGRKEELAEHGIFYIRSLLAQEDKPLTRRQREALGVYAECIKGNGDFFLPDARSVYELAQAARQFGMNDLGLRMVTKFHRRFPQSPLVPEAYFLAAQLLVDHKQQDEQAKPLLQFLIQHFPQHPLQPQIVEYLAVLERLQARAAAPSGAS